MSQPVTSKDCTTSNPARSHTSSKENCEAEVSCSLLKWTTTNFSSWISQKSTNGWETTEEMRRKKRRLWFLSSRASSSRSGSRSSLRQQMKTSWSVFRRGFPTFAEGCCWTWTTFNCSFQRHWRWWVWTTINFSLSTKIMSLFPRSLRLSFTSKSSRIRYLGWWWSLE